MIDWLDAMMGLGIGVAAGAIAGVLFMLLRKQKLVSELNNQRTRTTLLDTQLIERTGEIERLRTESNTIDDDRESAQRQVSVLTEQLKERQVRFDEQKKMLDEAKEKLTDTTPATRERSLQGWVTIFSSVPQQ